jgi:hypothetical protein
VRHGTAKAGSDGAPLVVTATGRTDWDETQTGGVKPYYEVQNVGKKPIVGFEITCHGEKDDSPTSVAPNDPLEPGEVTHFASNGKQCHATAAQFTDGADWKK